MGRIVYLFCYKCKSYNQLDGMDYEAWESLCDGQPATFSTEPLATDKMISHLSYRTLKSVIEESV